MRSLEEIDADIAEVKARIAKRNEGMPSYGDPGYRAARFDYIVEGDRSGLDAYQNAVNAAIQNKLSREEQEKLVKLNKKVADEEDMDQWQKDYAFAKNAQSEIYNNPASTQKQKEDADATVRYYESVGKRRKYLDKYKAMTAVPVEAAASSADVKETPKQEAQKETFKQLIAKGQTLETDEDLDKHISELLAYKGNDAVVKEAYDAIKAAQDKKQSNIGKRWATFQDNVDAAIKAKDKAKLQELQKRMESEDELKNQKDSATTKQKIDAALKPKPKSPLPKYIKNTFTPDIIQQKYMRDLNEKGEVKLSATIAGKSLPFKMVRKPIGNIEFVDDKGNVLYTIKAKDFDIEATAPKKKESPVAGALKSGWTARSNIKVGDNEDW